MHYDKQTQLLQCLSDGKLHAYVMLSNTLKIPNIVLQNTLDALASYGLKINRTDTTSCYLEKPLELLDNSALVAELDPAINKTINTLQMLAITHSTNQYCLENFLPLGKYPNIALAEFQTHGRGQHGNTWLSPIASGLNLSIHWRFKNPISSIAHTCLPLKVSATVIAVLHEIGFPDVGLKWPNDIIFQEQKLGGILIETKTNKHGQQDIIVGIGLNIDCPSSFSKNIDQAVTDLASIKKPLPKRNYIAAKLIAALIAVLKNYHYTNNQDIIDEWRRYDHISGKHAKLVLPNQSISGLVLGVDNNGCLLFDVNGSIQKYTTGTVRLKMQPCIC